jgi:hypothetical protein
MTTPESAKDAERRMLEARKKLQEFVGVLGFVGSASAEYRRLLAEFDTAAEQYRRLVEDSEQPE